MVPAWLVLAAAMALLMVSVRRHERQSAFFGRGFVEGAQAIIDSGYIALDCDSMQVRARFPAGSDAERWYSLSYLREDVRRFNSDPERVPGPFVVDYDACRLEGVDRYYHRIDLPFTPSLAWRGDIVLSGGRRSAILDSRSIPQTIEIRPPADVRDATNEHIAWPAGPGSVSAGSLVQVRSAARGPLLSELYFVGDNLVLADRRKEGAPYRIRVSGHELLDGRVVRVETGDWVQFSGPGLGGGTPRGRAVPTYLARVGADSRLASFVRVQNEDVDRLYAAPGLRPFLEPLAQAMNSLAQSDESGWLGAGGQDTVQLTLDQELSESLQRTLSAWCTRNRLDRRPRAVSALVMDGFTGAVRGIPSCPTADELTGYAGLTPADRDRRLRNQNLVRHEIGSAGKPFWAAAVASAHPTLLDLQVPGHLTGPASSALGCSLPGSYQDHGHAGPGGWVGMESFLAGSCNRYIVEMATAALTLRERSSSGRPCTDALPADQFASCFTPPSARDSASRFHICDAVVHAVLAPNSRFVAEDCQRLKLVGAEFRPVPNLQEITNVEWYFRGAPDSMVAHQQAGGQGTAGERSAFQDAYLFGRYRIDAWRRLTGSLANGRSHYFPVETGLRFASVSPEQTNLQLNTVDNLRSEWISVLLGGATSRWSNFQLAEALSRLMTGRGVQGEFVDSIRTVGLGGMAAQVNARRAYPLLDARRLHDGVRRRVLHGMELVVEEGTASPLNAAVAALRDSLARGAAGAPYDLFVFAKTGTPAVSKLVPHRRQRVLQQLFRHLRWNEAAQRVDVTPEGTRLLELQRRSSPEWYRWFQGEVRAPLEADPSLFRIRGAEVPPRHPLYIVGDRLYLNVMQDVEIMRQGGVLILGFLAVPRGEGRTSTDPAAAAISVCRLDPGLRGRILSVPASRGMDPNRSVALSVAIYVDDLAIGVTSAKAVELANQLMPELSRYFLLQARIQVQGGTNGLARRRL
jgi:cell division protein FtsI/penicillin-binding protein 2